MGDGVEGSSQVKEDEYGEKTIQQLTAGHW